MAVRHKSKCQKKHPIEFADFPTGNNQVTSSLFCTQSKAVRSIVKAIDSFTILRNINYLVLLFCIIADYSAAQYMSELSLEQSIRNRLPPLRRILLHIAGLVALAYSVGPWLGPRLFGLSVSQSTWGRGQAYDISDMMNWGTFFLMVELVAYTAWIMKQGRKGYDEYQMKQWRKALEGEVD